MTKYIDADALKTALYYDVSKGTYGEFTDGSEVSLTDREILRLIDQQPTVDAEPVRHGKWIFESIRGHAVMTCSECCKVQDGQTLCFTYCPNCGARMDKE